MLSVALRSGLSQRLSRCMSPKNDACNFHHAQNAAVSTLMLLVGFFLSLLFFVWPKQSLFSLSLGAFV